MDAADEHYKTTLAYHGDTEVVTSRTTPTATFTYTVTPGTGVLVDGLTITPSEGQPETVPLKIDALGRTTVTRMAGIGAVRHKTDAFGNPLSVTKETSGAAVPTKNQEALFSWEYAQGKVAFTDHWNARPRIKRGWQHLAGQHADRTIESAAFRTHFQQTRRGAAQHRARDHQNHQHHHHHDHQG
ncbi:hypothetical protein [Acanthopleuribacter pedis]